MWLAGTPHSRPGYEPASPRPKPPATSAANPSTTRSAIHTLELSSSTTSSPSHEAVKMRCPTSRQRIDIRDCNSKKRARLIAPIIRRSGTLNR